MSVAASKAMTVPEFLAWVEGESERYELVDGEPVAMAPERARHNLVKSNVLVALRAALEGSGCTVFGDGMTVVVDEHTAYEPDAVVTCQSAVDLDATTVPEPVIVVEVLSPSSESVDSGRKLADYLSVDAVRHYLVLDPTKRVLMHHRREQGDEVTTRIWRTGVVELWSPAARLEVEALFEGA
jgi:Uma2 family endonuclease